VCESVLLLLLLFLLLFSMCVYIYTQEEARGNVL